MQLSHKDLVELGMHESEKGHSLSDIEADFTKKGIERKAIIKALKEIEYYNKKEALKAEKEKKVKEAESQKQQAQGAGHETAPQGKKESSFWIIIFILLILIGLALFYYFYNKKF